ncbi:gas vesicle protein GvpG [Streptomyces sp. NPDC050534]|uniref:gas vesicle protein GvpG n=1 Tax=Streptomyces sp. NPDC050534 TaxID=3365625 RepID=UPI0037930051
MGLVSGLLLLPLAPLRGTLWVADHLLQEAERQTGDPRAVQARLAALNRALEEGAIDEAAFEKEEERLLERLDSPVRYTGRPPASTVRVRTAGDDGGECVPARHRHPGGAS